MKTINAATMPSDIWPVATFPPMDDVRFPEIMDPPLIGVWFIAPTAPVPAAGAAEYTP